MMPDPVGYTFVHNKKDKLNTDLGHVNDKIKDNIRESSLILLELITILIC